MDFKSLTHAVTQNLQYVPAVEDSGENLIIAIQTRKLTPVVDAVPEVMSAIRPITVNIDSYQAPTIAAIQAKSTEDHEANFRSTALAAGFDGSRITKLIALIKLISSLFPAKA